MAFKVVWFVITVATVVGELNHPSYYPNSLPAYVISDGDRDVQDGYSFIEIENIQRQNNLQLSYDPSSTYIEGQGSSWNYLIPVENSHSAENHRTCPEPSKLLQLTASSWTRDDAIRLPSTTATPTTGLSRPGEIPFGYVQPVAKITVPPGYKIHRSL